MTVFYKNTFIILKIQAIQKYTKKVTTPNPGNKMLTSGEYHSTFPSKYI